MLFVLLSLTSGFRFFADQEHGDVGKNETDKRVDQIVEKQAEPAAKVGGHTVIYIEGNVVDECGQEDESRTR